MSEKVLVCEYCKAEMTGGVAAHFEGSPSCEDACMAEARRGHDEWMEHLRVNDPKQYEAMLFLESIRPVAGTDPLFDYKTGQLKPR